MREMLGFWACVGLAMPLAAQQAQSPVVSPAPPVAILPPLPNTDQLAVAPIEAPPPFWSTANVNALLGVIRGVGGEGLFPADYEPDALANAFAKGESAELNAIATKQFRRLAQDFRDGRTPFAGRIQWFVRDPDSAAMPTDALLAKALETGDVGGVLNSLHPKHADYAALKAELAATPAKSPQRQQVIRVNMERWRWMPQELGFRHVIANIPEYQLRFIVNSKLVRSYKAVVGKPGTSATPQLAEMAQGVIFNPTWTVPQSIIKTEMQHRIGKGNEGISGDFKWTRGAKGFVTMVQQAGPNNSLGLMKIDMPNAHAIFVHDTPSRERFNQPARALSHGCVRAERASELGIMLAAIFGGVPVEKGVEILKTRKTTKVPFTSTVPVYTAYFTIATGLDGKLQNFADIYERDAPVLASLAQPRMDRPETDAQTAPVIENKMPGI